MRTVALMTSNQVGTLHSQTGLGFGLGFETTDRYGANGMDSVGSYGWAGAYSSTYRVDPDARLVIVFMVTAPLLTVGVPVDLPQTRARLLGQDREPIAVSIDNSGKIFLQNTPITASPQIQPRGTSDDTDVLGPKIDGCGRKS